MDEELTFGVWLRRSRKARDLTQRELAKELNCAVGTIRKLEADDLRPSKELAARLAVHFGLPTSDREAFIAYAREHADPPLVAASAHRGPSSPAPPHVREAGPPASPPGLHDWPSSSAARRTNLPAQLTSFIGRERDVATVQQQLIRPDVRLLTLTGLGGMGKTRIALQVAWNLLDHFRDGVWFVDLAPVRDPRLVVSAIATVLGIPDTGPQALAARLRTFLGEHEVLLVLDNFEQVVPAASLVAELLAAAPRLTVLITSRVVVGVYGEHDVVVPPLTVPDPHHLPPLDTLRDVEAIQLFVARAAAANADFLLTPDNVPLVVEICHVLEGLPLAIELAAARLRHLPLETIRARVGNRLTLLTGGARTLPPRQQTLRDTLAWSYDLLDEGEQRLFRRLAVFVGGWKLEAAETVCNAMRDLPCAVLDGLAALVDKSLVRQERPVSTPGSWALMGESRFAMLETVREYALEQATAHGELEGLRAWHAAYYVLLAETAAPELRGPRQAVWLARLEREHNNLRAALGWSEQASDPTAGELGVRLAVALWEFWSRRGYLQEGRRWVEVALARVPMDAAQPGVCRLRARALSAAGNLAAYQGDMDAAWPLLAESLALFERLGDTWETAYLRMNLGLTVHQLGNIYQGVAQIEESVSRFRMLGDHWGTAWALSILAQVLVSSASNGEARGTDDRAIAHLEESVVHFQKVGDIMGTGAALASLGSLLKQRGDDQRARGLLAEGLVLCHEVGSMLPIPDTLRELADVVADGQEQDAVRAARLYGVAEALVQSMGSTWTATRPRYQQAIATLRAGLGERAFETAWAEGRAMPLEQAIAYALGGAN